MRATELLSVMDRLAAGGIVAWLDGGWAVDALVGTQTREHSDLDVALDVTALRRVTSMLRSDGFVVLRDELPTAIAFRNEMGGTEVDLHPLALTANGGGDQAQPAGAVLLAGDPAARPRRLPGTTMTCGCSSSGSAAPCRRRTRAGDLAHRVRSAALACL